MFCRLASFPQAQLTSETKPGEDSLEAFSEDTPSEIIIVQIPCRPCCSFLMDSRFDHVAVPRLNICIRVKDLQIYLLLKVEYIRYYATT